MIIQSVHCTSQRPRSWCQLGTAGTPTQQVLKLSTLYRASASGRAKEVDCTEQGRLKVCQWKSG